MWVCDVTPCLRIRDAEIRRPPGNLVITAMFVTLKTGVHGVLGTHEWLLVVILQISNRFVDLLLKTNLMTIHAIDIECRMVAG